MDLRILGSKLRTCREVIPQSPSEVSSATGIEVGRIVAIEEGEVEPSGDEVLILSDYYLEDIKNLLYNDRTPTSDQAKRLYRKHDAELGRNDRIAIREFLFLCEAEAFLERELDIDNRNVTQFDFSKVGTFHKKHGEDAARSLRQALSLEITERIDVFAHARRLGIHIFRRELDNSSISGVFIRHPSVGRCVLINYSEDLYRQTFTAAHELGHALLDDDEEFNVNFWKNKDLKEIRANRFASCLLAPPELLKNLGDGSTWDAEKLINIAGRLRLNPSVLVYALKDCQVLSSEQAKHLEKVKVPKSEKTDPELQKGLSANETKRRLSLIRRGLSPYYIGLCLRAVRENVISLGRGAEMALVSRDQFREISSAFGEASNVI